MDFQIYETYHSSWGKAHAFFQPQLIDLNNDEIPEIMTTDYLLYSTLKNEKIYFSKVDFSKLRSINISSCENPAFIKLLQTPQILQFLCSSNDSFQVAKYEVPEKIELGISPSNGTQLFANNLRKVFAFFSNRGIEFLLINNGKFGFSHHLNLGPVLNSQNKINFLLGKINDLNDDGIDELVIAVRQFKARGYAFIISGKIEDNQISHIKDKLLLEIRGVLEYSESNEFFADFDGDGKKELLTFGGVGSSIPFSSGDLDRDNISELSITSHLDFDLSGALYIISGKNLKNAILENIKVIEINDPCVTKFVGAYAQNLAPPHFHWQNIDFDQDGNKDILITEDANSEIEPLQGIFRVISYSDFSSPKCTKSK